ncbi:MAG: lytic transglycosylase domain-containing protein, partial [Pseudomonadota bacterium]|nr:lytic transglycosylase domain-containing protein [Pseudomonadota bacterium]
AATETAILREFAVLLTREDHAARASRLLYAERGGAAWRAATLAGPDIQALIRARWEAAKGPLTARTSSAVPPAARSDPGFLFAHVQDARRAGRLDEAAAWLALAPHDAAKLVDPDKWWSERRMVARLLLDRGENDKAYKVSDEAIARSSPARVDAAFFAGWVALRFLNDPARAAPHFAAAAQAAETPISIARAHYWRGRAAEAAGAMDEARAFYGKAAAYPIAYYGQLAAQKLGATEVTLRRPAVAATGDERAEATRVIELYLAAGLDDFVAPVAYAAAKAWDDEAQLAALAQVLRERASAATNVVFGKLATERGFPLDAVAFPTFGLPEFEPLSGSAALGQVLAVARQESEFIPRAASGAGAKGLMQILPTTAADTARKAGVAYDYGRLLSDPSYNMQLGAAFLGQLVTAEGGSLPMAAAAYNAGGGRVAQWVNAFGDPRNGADIVDWVERIPFDETRDYVMRVMENYGVYQARLAEAPEPRASGALAKR